MTAALTPEQQLAGVAAEAAGATPKAPVIPPDEAELVARVSEAAEHLEGDQSAEYLATLTADDLVDLVELAFSLIALKRGEHWALAHEEGVRIGKWARKAIERHGLAWVGKWLPDLMVSALLAYAILKRVERDKELAEQGKREAIQDLGAEADRRLKEDA